MAKAGNMLAVLWLLRSRRRMTAHQLAGELEVSVRTVYRYIDDLCASGVPVLADSGHDGGYSLPDSFRGAPLVFEPDELAALSHAALFAWAAGHPSNEALGTALAKVGRNLTPEQKRELDRQTATLAVADRLRGGPVDPWLSGLQQAAADGATVELQYLKPEAAAVERRTVDPYGVAFRSGYWYLVGFCHGRQALREFRIDRVRALARTGARFERPPGFRIQEEFSDDWIQEQIRAGDLAAVRLEGEPWAIEAVCGHWYLRHCVAERSPAGVLLQVDPTGRGHLPRYLLTLGTGIRVAAPVLLRVEVAALAREWAEYHNAEIR